MQSPLAMDVPGLGRWVMGRGVGLTSQVIKLAQQLGPVIKLRNRKARFCAQLRQLEVRLATACIVPPGVGTRSRGPSGVVGIIVAETVRARTRRIFRIAARGEVHSPMSVARTK